jgi:RimJ/RimL family protein N-acetyltransferase
MALPVPTGPLRSGNVALRAWEPDDAEWYVTARDGEVFRWTTEPSGLSVELVRAVIRENRRAPAWIGLAITDEPTGRLLGNIALRPSACPETAEIMYWLAADARGRGAATLAVRALCAWAFATLGLERVTLRTHAGNVASQGVARRAGFRQRGVEDERLIFELRSSLGRASRSVGVAGDGADSP